MCSCLAWLFCLSRYDFFIVSQAVRSGSVSPTHYNVIYDSSGLKPDHIQRLTYKLCHVYYNWPVSALLFGPPFRASCPAQPAVVRTLGVPPSSTQ